MRIKGVMVVAAAAALAALALAGPAGARSLKTTSSFAFGVYKPTAALGYINMSRGPKACQARRRVKLYRARGGRDRRVGSDRSTSTGYWEIRKRLRRGGRYYVKIARKRVGRRGHRNVCRPYRSSTLRFPSGRPVR